MFDFFYLSLSERTITIQLAKLLKHEDHAFFIGIILYTPAYNLTSIGV